MAQLNFEIPDNQIELAINMFALKFGPYPTEITRHKLDEKGNPILATDEHGNELEGHYLSETVLNPQSKAEFVHAKLAEWAKFAIIEQQRKEAMKTAEQGIKLDEISVK